MNNLKELSCQDRVDRELAKTLADLAKLWWLYNEGDGEDDGDPELGRFHDYGLSIDYVQPNTFQDQPFGFLRYQISTGGPGDEFRFFIDADLRCYKVEYWFLDWFDGASRILEGDSFKLMLEIYDHFVEIGTVEHCLTERD